MARERQAINMSITLEQKRTNRRSYQRGSTEALGRGEVTYTTAYWSASESLETANIPVSWTNPSCDVCAMSHIQDHPSHIA